jgi:alpha-mannosidase
MSRLVFHLIPHSHWDREWHLPEAALRVRLVAMLDDLLPRLESGTLPHFTLDGQAILLADYLAVRPERESLVAMLVRSGRLEIGPWYILADEHLVSGESLIRNLLEGRRLTDRFGRSSSALYSPDAFGHPAMLPDLAREFRLERAALWRGWGGARDAFHWTGPSGGKLFVYHLPRQGYEMGADLPADAASLPEAWRALRTQLVARASSPHVAVFVGADHHFVHRDLPTLARLLGTLEPGNDVRISRLDDFLGSHARLAHVSAEASGDLRDAQGHTWNLQGTHATRAPLKRRNSELELMLERIAAPLAGLAGGADLRAALAFAWRRLLENHFHDSICGTVSDAVAITMAERFAEVEAAGREVVRRSVWRVLGHDPDRARAGGVAPRPRLALWNPALRRRGGVVLARITVFRRDVLVGPPSGRTARADDAALPVALALASGERRLVQVLRRNLTTERLDADHHYPDQDVVEQATVAIEAPALAGLGWDLLQPAESSAPAPPGVVARGAALDNGIVRVGVSAGGLVELFDHARGERYADLLELVGASDTGDTYSPSPTRVERALPRITPVATRILAEGALVGALEATWSVRAGASPGRAGAGVVDVRLVLQVFKGSAVVRGRLELDNQAHDHRLRMRVPIGVPGEQPLAGAQFGTHRRGATGPAVVASTMEAPVTTFPVHRHASAATAGRGLAFLAPGFFEAEWQDGDLVVTLLRAIGELSRSDLATRPGHAAWPVPTPLAQCRGQTRIAFALAPVDAAQLASGDAVPALWEDAFVPIQAWWLRDATDLQVPGDFIEIEGEGLVLSAVKPAEDGAGAVVRVVNMRAQGVQGHLHLGLPRSAVGRTRADEREVAPVALTNGGRSVPLAVGPLGMATLVVK